jgi:outer membrane receptor protein involved in Fe transport
MNELYRTGQVGAQITLPNATLLSERATGAEGGLSWSSPHTLASLQATYFWTEINRPVAAVLVSGNTYMRENLGQIQSQGTELAAQLHPLPGLSVNVGYQYAHAVVTAFQTQPALIGLWIPDVSRHQATAQVRYQHGPGTFTLSGRESGRSFDDSLNTLELHGFFVLDAYAETRLRGPLSAYLSFQNLLNRSIETARTPNLTLGTPFTAQGGLRLRWGGR